MRRRILRGPVPFCHLRLSFNPNKKSRRRFVLGQAPEAQGSRSLAVTDTIVKSSMSRSSPRRVRPLVSTIPVTPEPTGLEPVAINR